jgi:vacuolar-type H+-ATPase subunit I/STV1
MALFRFRTRNPERDRETDSSRLQRLQQSLADIRAEMERERSGLRDRYEKVTADAAFSQQTLEDDHAGAAMSSKIDDMTGTMIRYTKRLATLQTQIDFVTEMGRRVEAFSHANTEERAVA